MEIVVPALVAGIHVLKSAAKQRRGWPEQVRPWRRVVLCKHI